jgi:selenocysteine-specific elongation factor
VKFFCGSAESAAHVRLVGDRELEPGAAGWLQIRLTEPLALDKGDRFILRYPSPSQTIGGGVLLDPHPPHRWRRFKPEIIRRFETLSIGTPDELLYQALDGQVALVLKQASDLAGLSLPEAEEALQMLISRGECLVLPDGWVMTQAAWQRVSGRLVQEITAYHAQYPLKSGIPREALRSRLAVEGKLFNALIKQAVEEGAVQDSAAFICLPGHQVTFNDLQQQAVNRLLAVIGTNPASPPSVREASEMVGEEVLQVLFERQELIQVSSEVFFDARTYHELVGQVEDYITQHGSITVAQARDLFGSSRKYILALLEHLDNTGVTKRVGDERQLRRPRNG